MAACPLKVVHVIQRDDTATGGALRVAFELVRQLPEYDIDAKLLFLYGEKGYFGSQIPERSEYLHIGSSRNLWQLGRFRTYLKAVRPDVVHFHDDLLWPQLITSGHRSWKTVIHAHGGGTPPPQPLKTKLMYSYQRHYADAVVCITQEARSSQLRNAVFRPEMIHVIYNGVDAHHYRLPSPNECSAAKSRFGLPSNSVVVGYVGRLHDAMKGCRDFIELVAALPENYVGLVVGAGPDAEALRLQADSLGIRHRIRFVGLMDDPLPAYYAMSVFCFTSRHEPFGLTVAEAMACGVPVVGFECPGGTNEILTNVTGCVIPIRNVKAMANAVQSAAKRVTPWDERVIEAHKRIITYHQWDRAADQLAQLYLSHYRASTT